MIGKRGKGREYWTGEKDGESQEERTKEGKGEYSREGRGVGCCIRDSSINSGIV